MDLGELTALVAEWREHEDEIRRNQVAIARLQERLEGTLEETWSEEDLGPDVDAERTVEEWSVIVQQMEGRCYALRRELAAAQQITEAARNAKRNAKDTKTARLRIQGPTELRPREGRAEAVMEAIWSVGGTWKAGDITAALRAEWDPAILVVDVNSTLQGLAKGGRIRRTGKGTWSVTDPEVERVRRLTLAEEATKPAFAEPTPPSAPATSRRELTAPASTIERVEAWIATRRASFGIVDLATGARVSTGYARTFVGREVQSGSLTMLVRGVYIRSAITTKKISCEEDE